MSPIKQVANSAEKPAVDYEAVVQVAEQWARVAQSDDERKTVSMIIRFARDLADSPSMQKQFDEILRDFFCDYCTRKADVTCSGPHANVPCQTIAEWRQTVANG